MALYPQLLELRKETRRHQTTPFLLSLRDAEEFSSIHSFGFFKVPHIGVYGVDYSICSPVLLLSLPAVPRSLQHFPADLISGLDLNISRDPQNADLPGREEVRRVAKTLVQLALEGAVTRFRNQRGAGISSLAWRGKDETTAKEGWSTNTSAVTFSDMDYYMEGSMDTNYGSAASLSRPRPSAGEKKRIQFADVVMEEEEREDPSVVRNVARRLVFKCIRSACYRVESQGRRDSIEYLIASTKRMRIASPSPSTPEKPLSPERSLTPESDKLQRQRKKRGRSDSHEVTSLKDYDTLWRHFGGDVGSERDRRGEKGGPSGHSDNGVIREERRVGNDMLGSLVDTMGMMTIDESGLESDSEELELEEQDSPNPSYVEKYTPFNENVGRNNLSPLVYTQMTAVPFTVPPAPVASDSDIRLIANLGSVPGMDVYIIIHSYPPPGICQKFLCQNINEINLVYHCWLFGDVSCDPHMLASSELEVGVFDPNGVQPIHLDLQDGGAPFHYLEKRTICIHNCCFSPDNAQLQLCTPPAAAASATDTGTFYSFLSAARHGERRVAALHFLPSTGILEQRLREVLTGCSTLGQLFSSLQENFPEIGSKIWYPISAL